MRFYTFILIVLGVSIFIGCGDPFSYPPNEYDLYSYELDATDYNVGEGYFLFQADGHVERIEAGEQRRVAYYYYAGTMCQMDMNRQYNCVIDSTELTQVMIPEGNPLLDLIKIKYTGTGDVRMLNRRQPLIDNYFARPLPTQDTTFTISALPMDTNRIIIHKDNMIFIDTTFYVGMDTLNLEL